MSNVFLTGRERLERIIHKMISAIGNDLFSHDISLNSFDTEHKAFVLNMFGQAAFSDGNQFREAGNHESAQESYLRAIKLFSHIYGPYQPANLRSELLGSIIDYAENPPVGVNLNWLKHESSGFLRHLDEDPEAYLPLKELVLDYSSFYISLEDKICDLLKDGSLVKSTLSEDEPIDPASSSAEKVLLVDLLFTADRLALKNYTPTDLVRYTQDFYAMAELYQQVGLSQVADFCRSFCKDYDGTYELRIKEGKINVSRTEELSITTAYREERIKALEDLGFEAGQHRVTYHAVAGSTQLWKNGGFNFYVGNNYVVGEYMFTQPSRDIRIISDDILLLILDRGFSMPLIESDSEIGEERYILKINGNDPIKIYDNLHRIKDAVEGLRESIPYSEELAERNSQIVDQRFMAMRNKVLRTLPPFSDEPDSLGALEDFYEHRAEGDRAELLSNLSQLVVAVREDRKTDYGGIIAGITASAIPLSYDPQQAITNILAGRFLYSVPK
ncbi:MAG: hypothetical protein WCV90_01070 [Candidatus Woesearchaeota archaeon]